MLRQIYRTCNLGARVAGRMFSSGPTPNTDNKFERKSSQYRSSSEKNSHAVEVARLARAEQIKRESITTQLEARIQLFRDKVADTPQAWDLFIPEMIAFAWIGRCYLEAGVEILSTADLPMLGVPLLVQCGRLLAILINENDLNPTSESSPAPILKNHKGDVSIVHKPKLFAIMGTLLTVCMLPVISPSISLVLYTYAGLGVYNAMLLDNAGENGQSIPGKRVKYFAIFFMYMVLMILADFRQRGLVKKLKSKDNAKPNQGKLEDQKQVEPKPTS
jgi:hypothetical protein